MIVKQLGLFFERHPQIFNGSAEYLLGMARKLSEDAIKGIGSGELLLESDLPLILTKETHRKMFLQCLKEPDYDMLYHRYACSLGGAGTGL